MNGQELANIRARQDERFERERRQHNIRYGGGPGLAASRANYRRMLQRAIKGQQGPLFRNNTPTGSLVMSNMKFTQGSSLASEYAAVNQPLVSAARKIASDTVAAQRFMYPSTDILAYHRRIEHPEVYTHEPRYGF